MKTQDLTTRKFQKNNVLGLYTLFMVSLSITYFITTWLQHSTL